MPVRGGVYVKQLVRRSHILQAMPRHLPAVILVQIVLAVAPISRRHSTRRVVPAGRGGPRLAEQGSKVVVQRVSGGSVPTQARSVLALEARDEPSRRSRYLLVPHPVFVDDDGVVGKAVGFERCKIALDIGGDVISKALLVPAVVVGELLLDRTNG